MLSTIKIFAFLIKICFRPRSKAYIKSIRKVVTEGSIIYLYSIAFIPIGRTREEEVDKKSNSAKLYKTNDKLIVFYKKKNYTSYITNSYRDVVHGLLVWVIVLLFTGLSIYQFYTVEYINPNYNETNRIYGVLFLFIISSIILYLIYKEYKKVITFRKNGIKTSGKIVGYKEIKDLDETLKFKPIVEFYDLNNIKHRFIANLKYENNKRVNSRINVVYNNSDPTNVRIDSFFSFWAFLLFCIVGLIFCMSVIIHLLT